MRRPEAASPRARKRRSRRISTATRARARTSGRRREMRPSRANAARRGTSADAGNAPADSEDDSEADARSEGSDSGSEEEVSGLAALIRKLALMKAEEKKAASPGGAAPAPAETEEPLPPVLSSFDLRGVAEHIRNGKCGNVIVMAGAGISVSAGIPDFRTPGTGLYDNLAGTTCRTRRRCSSWTSSARTPSTLLPARGAVPGQYPPTPTHRFVRLLHEKGLLLRCFTQNIDSLEAAAGIPADKIVAAHGKSLREVPGGARRVRREVKAHVDRGAVMRCARDDCGAGQARHRFRREPSRRFGEKAARTSPSATCSSWRARRWRCAPVRGPGEPPGGGRAAAAGEPRARGRGGRARARDGGARRAHRRAGIRLRAESNRRDALFLGDCDDGFRGSRGCWGGTPSWRRSSRRGRPTRFAEATLTLDRT